jgi:hypothetical protein
MTENTSTNQYLPFECISPNLLKNADSPDAPSQKGTGFFCRIPPYQHLFYVTTKACLEGIEENNLTTALEIPYPEALLDKAAKRVAELKAAEAKRTADLLAAKGEEPEDKAVKEVVTEDKTDETEADKYVKFSACLSAKFIPRIPKPKEELKPGEKPAPPKKKVKNAPPETIPDLENAGPERLLVFVVDKTITDIQKKVLEMRSVTLWYQLGIEKIHKRLCEVKDEIQAIAFSQGSETSAFNGTISELDVAKGEYNFDNSNWTEKDYQGLQGSPVFNLNTNGVTPIHAVILGVMFNPTETKGEFLSINAVTDLIADYIYKS